MKRIFTAFVALSACIMAEAQNLDQKVEVTNTYETVAGTVVKQELPVSLPDSVTRFDYRFDYTSFATPYKGAYEFRPYLVNPVPEPSAYRASRFFLTADAGYTFRPSLHAVWTPIDSSRVKLSVYNDFDGFCGKYSSLGERLLPDGGTKFGYAFREELGTRADFIFKDMDLSVVAAYDGLFSEESQAYNSATALIGLKGHDDLPFPWHVNVDYRYGYDSFAEGLGLHENALKLDGNFTAQFRRRYLISVDMLADMDFLSGKIGGAKMNFSVAPHALLYFGNVDLKLGVNLSHDCRTFRIFPSCEIAVNMLKGALRLFAGADGGNTVDRYFDFKNYDPHFNPGWYPSWENNPQSACTARTVDAFLGLQGYIGKHFHYDLRGGYARYVHRPFADAMSWYMYGTPGIVFTTASEAYASLKMNWDSDRIDASATLDFHKLLGKVSGEALEPPMFTAGVKAVYNWRRRIFAGVSLDAATNMTTTLTGVHTPVAVDVPGWADLGLSLEYRITPCWGLRLSAGNLLGHPVRRYSPFYVEHNQSVSLGLTLIL